MTFIISAAIVVGSPACCARGSRASRPRTDPWVDERDRRHRYRDRRRDVLLRPIVGAFVFLYIRWGISRFPTLEAYWELFFGALLIGVVLYFKQAVGGLLLLRDRLLETAAGDDGGGDADGGETASSDERPAAQERLHRPTTKHGPTAVITRDDRSQDRRPPHSSAN